MAKGELHADAYRVEKDHQLNISVLCNGDGQSILNRARDLCLNYVDLLQQAKVPVFHEKDMDAVAGMPNPLRALADGDIMYSSFVDLFGDDVSGNRSKSWNKHWNTYFAHRNLPRRLLQQEFHVHFLSTSGAQRRPRVALCL
ncbi:hypothetical protein OF83DRAFT_839167 [Amylostereum chailletii]|nr:hypothetical protein OF83DRAFT_839167 [Amylostereum chailletii]